MAAHDNSSAAWDATSFDRWYPRFRRVSPRSEIIQLSPDFVEYLLDERIFLPGDDDSEAAWSDDDGDEHQASGDKEEPDEDTAEALERLRKLDFSPLLADIDAAISRLGGSAFVKMNWSSPRDAAWVLGGSLRCASARDVVMLLKSSQHIAHDLRSAPPARDRAQSPAAARRAWVLVLRTWCQLQPANEFRCFVSAGALLCASQRDRYTRYAHLHDRREQLARTLAAFCADVLGPACARAGSSRADAPADTPAAAAERALGVERVVADVYVDAGGKAHLLDLSPFDESTDPLLYTWAEVLGLAAAADTELSAAGDRIARVPAPTLRLLDDGGAGVQPSPTIYMGVPLELQPRGAAETEQSAADSEPPRGASADGGVSSAVDLMRAAALRDAGASSDSEDDAVLPVAGGGRLDP